MLFELWTDVVPLVRVEDLLGKGTAVLSWPAAGAAAAGSIDLGGIDITHGVVVYVFCCWVSWPVCSTTANTVAQSWLSTPGHILPVTTRCLLYDW